MVHRKGRFPMVVVDDNDLSSRLLRVLADVKGASLVTEFEAMLEKILKEQPPDQLELSDRLKEVIRKALQHATPEPRKEDE